MNTNLTDRYHTTHTRQYNHYTYNSKIAKRKKKIKFILNLIGEIIGGLGTLAIFFFIFVLLYGIMPIPDWV